MKGLFDPSLAYIFERGFTKMKSMNRILAIAGCLLLLFAASACGGGGGGSVGGNGPTLSQAANDFFANAKNTLESEGRPYNNVYSAKLGESLKNTFFDWVVSAVSKETSIDGFTPDSGNAFITADIKSTNVFEEAIPVGNYDFFLLYENEDGEIIETVAFEEFTDGMYPDDVSEEVGETVEGFLVFEVPESVDAAMLTYYEIWDDDFEGDTYYFEVNL
jgi:hypothetical protein